MEKERVFYKANFCMTLNQEIFPGYTDGDTWNGWACPYFAHDEAIRILNALDNKWEYDEQKDAFSVWVPEYNEPEIFESVMIQVDSQDVKTYAIGAYSWIWDICE